MKVHKMPVQEYLSGKVNQIPGKENALVYYHRYKDYNGVTKIKFKTPEAMTAALISARKIFDHILKDSGSRLEELEILWRYIKSNPLMKDKRVTGIIPPGRTSLAVELSNGKVLKLSRRHPFVGRSFEKDFDVALIGNVEKYLDNGVDYYVYTQGKANMDNTTQKHMSTVLRMLTDKGYTPVDINMSRYDQVGIYRRKPYLVDSECAQ